MATLIGAVVNESGFLLRLPDHLPMSEDDFFEFCAANRDLRIERTAEGDILVMAPAGIRTGGSNSGIIAQLWDWADQDGTGMAFDSNTGFTLPNGSVYSPDAAWILNARLEELPEAEIVRFGHIWPDFGSS